MGTTMSTRLTEREIVRTDIQQIFHLTFNTLEQAKKDLFEEATTPEGHANPAEFLAKMAAAIEALNDNFEALRSRVLPIVG